MNKQMNKWTNEGTNEWASEPTNKQKVKLVDQKKGEKNFKVQLGHERNG